MVLKENPKENLKESHIQIIHTVRIGNHSELKNIWKLNDRELLAKTCGIHLKWYLEGEFISLKAHIRKPKPKQN